ncbi:MAG: OsmC family peroxiredoxin, partial [Pseudolabrys sp.]
MDAGELRAMQAPIKERYKSDPKTAFITLKAKGTLDDSNSACKVETGRALATAGLHPATGGSGLELCSGYMLLEALVACAGVTVKAVATALDIPLKSGNVSAEGDLDFRGTLGVTKDA